MSKELLEQQFAAVDAQQTHTSTGQPEKSENPLLKLNPGVSIWTLLTFLILLILLKKFVWGPILSAIADRDSSLKSSMESAEQARNESKKIANEQKSILAESKSQAAQIVAEAKKTAEQNKRKIEQNAQEEKAKILKTADDEINAMKEKAISEIKEKAANLAVIAAEKIIGDQLDKAKAKSLADDYINKLEA